MKIPIGIQPIAIIVGLASLLTGLDLIIDWISDHRARRGKDFA